MGVHPNIRFVTDSVTTKRNNVSQVGVYRRSLELLVTRQMTAAKSGDKDHGARGVSVSQFPAYLDLISVPVTTNITAGEFH